MINLEILSEIRSIFWLIWIFFLINLEKNRPKIAKVRYTVPKMGWIQHCTIAWLVTLSRYLFTNILLFTSPYLSPLSIVPCRARLLITTLYYSWSVLLVTPVLLYSCPVLADHHPLLVSSSTASWALQHTTLHSSSMLTEYLQGPSHQQPRQSSILPPPHHECDVNVFHKKDCLSIFSLLLV